MGLYSIAKRFTPLPLRTLARPLTEVVETRLRARRLRRLYARFIRRGDLVFDVGAYRGEHTAHLLALGARVVAVEPDRTRAAGLSRRFGAEPNVIIASVAVGAQPSRATLYTSQVPAHATLHPDMQIARFPKERFESAGIVEVTTLDRLIKCFGVPALIKLDIEGGELDALQGLTVRPKFVMFEFSFAHFNAADACMDKLRPSVFNATLRDSHKLIYDGPSLLDPEYHRDIIIGERGIGWASACNLMRYLRDTKAPCGDIIARLA